MPIKHKYRHRWLNLLRIHQWTKNALLFIPAITAHSFDDIQQLRTLTIAFMSFSLCASGAYILNDLMDMDHDRKHPLKQYRPLASGAVSPKVGLLVVPALFVGGLSLSFVVGESFIFWILVYVLLTCAYTLWLKRFSPIDVIILSFFYTIRVIAGASAINVSLSIWLLTFSFFIFLSLANLKRFVELQVSQNLNVNAIHGRNYATSDLPMVRTFGVSAGFTASLVLALYLQTETVLILYSSPFVIWISVPLILFWLSWLWSLAERGHMRNDPLDFALRDRVSLSVLIIAVICFMIASR